MTNTSLPTTKISNWLAHPMTPVLAIALIRLMIHIITGGQYGFHRDELVTLDNARHLAWGYVPYPPLTPFVAKLALTLFGPSLTGVRLFGALGQAVAVVLVGWMASALGGQRWAMAIASFAAAIATVPMMMGILFQYVGFDYLWWLMVWLSVVKLIQNEDPRWWLGIGLGFGLGMLTRYTMGVLVVAVVGVTLASSLRQYLRSPWLWAGVGISVLLVLPNVLWQMQHNWIGIDFTQAIRARDVAIGRTASFIPDQFLASSNPFTTPLWLMGLYFLLIGKAGQRFRSVGWMTLLAFGLFVVSQARGYYTMPIYPVWLAAGAVWLEGRLAELTARKRQVGQAVTLALLGIGAVIVGALALPIAPINSSLWEVTSGLHDNFAEQVGWQDLTETVAQVYATLDSDAPIGILTANNGEAGAINLYGPALGLPSAMSGVNSLWLRGYDPREPEIVIVVGFSEGRMEELFGTCEFAANITNRYGVVNEETLYFKHIYICQSPRLPWPELWEQLRAFG